MNNIVDVVEQDALLDPGLDRPGRRQLRARQAADDVRRRHRGGHHPRRGRRHPGFTQQGYLANLTPLIPSSLKASIPSLALGHGQLRPQDHRRAGHAPDLQRLREHGPAQGGGHQGADRRSPWTWDQFRAAAKKLTKNGNYGVCWGLSSPTATDPDARLNWGGQWNYLENGKWTLKVGPAEQKILTTIHDMIYADKSVDPAGVGLSGSAVLPAFFGGKCAMTVQGNYQAQGMIQQARRASTGRCSRRSRANTQDQAANPQTFSISQQSQHKAEAMQFIAYALNTQNMAKLAAGDWLIPASPAAAAVVVKSTKHYGSWRNAISAVPSITKANWVSLNNYPRWKAEVATPAFRVVPPEPDRASTTLIKQLTDGWTTGADGSRKRAAAPGRSLAGRARQTRRSDNGRRDAQ